MNKPRAWSCLASLALLLGTLGGCAGDGASRGNASAGSDRVSAVSLYGLPVAFSTTGGDTPMSFQVGVLFFRQDEPQAVRVRSGQVEFYLYEGRYRPGVGEQVKPFQFWRLSAAEIEPFAVRSLPGWGYQLALPVQGKPPTSNVVTLIARFRPLTGNPVDSEPMQLQFRSGGSGVRLDTP